MQNAAPPNTSKAVPVRPEDEHDAFLLCLQVVAAHYGRSVAHTVLTAGLPLVDGRLTSALLPKAAERVGLRAQIKRARIAELVPLSLPAILDVRDGAPIVLLGSLGAEGYLIYYPAARADRTISAQQLEEIYSGSAISLTPIYAAPEQPGFEQRTNEPRDWFWGVVRQYRRSYSAVIVAATVVNVIALATPLFIMNVYDRVIPNKAMETLWVFVAGLTLALMFDLLLKITRGQIIDRVGRKVDIDVACNLIEKILTTRLVDRPASTGALANRIQEYEVIREFFSSNTLMLFVDLSFFVLISAVIYILAGWIVMIPLAALVVVMVLGLIMQRRLSSVVRRAQDESALRHAVLVESISGLETIKSIRAEGHILQRWQNFARTAAESSEEAKYLSSLGLNSTSFVQQLVTIFIVVFSVYQFSAGAMTLGAIIATVMLSNRLMAPLSQIAMMFSRLHYVKLAFGHFDELMAKSDERILSPGFVNRRIEKGKIEFRGVEFSYPGATSPVLKDLNLIIHPGEKVGIVGRIGSGKTTLGRLLTGLYQPINGEILLDDVDIRQYHPFEVRSAIALVVQDGDLFYGSVRENLVMANPTASDETIVSAATMAGVDSFVGSHPEGYDMNVGERGARLSGGQRQCIALARAFLGDPRVMFLDEPSSSMDLQSERSFIQRLEEGMKVDQTQIIATHRQSMLKLVDRLLVIDKGKIVRDGSKDEVLKALTQSSAKTIGHQQ